VRLSEVEYRLSPELGEDELNALFSSAWSGHRPTDFSYLRTHSLGWVGAFSGDRLVGFVNLAWDGHTHAFVLDTTVHPEYQRRGIGQALVGRAVDLARHRGMEWVHVDFEPAWEGFYRRCGFRGTAAGLVHLV